MAGIYRNGKSYGGGIPLPDGGVAGQFLKKHSATPNDIEWADVDALPTGGTAGQVLTKQSSIDGDAAWETAAGCIYSYIVGSTTFASDWLSTTPSGTAFTPNAKELYLVLTAGTFYHNFLRWDSSSSKYIVIGSGLVAGYYKVENGKFYEDSAYVTEIVGVSDSIYVSIDTDKPFWFDGTNFKPFKSDVSDDDMDIINSSIDSAIELSVPTLLEYTQEELDAILDQIDFSGSGAAVEMSNADMVAIWNTVFS